MSANINTAGEVKQLDRRPEPDENITETSVQDPKSLARFLLRLFREVANQKRAWSPRRVDFEDLAVDASGTTIYTLAHNFAGRVRWWIVDWTGAAAPSLSKDASTNDNILALVSSVVGTVTVRVEEAG